MPKQYKIELPAVSKYINNTFTENPDGTRTAVQQGFDEANNLLWEFELKVLLIEDHVQSNPAEDGYQLHEMHKVPKECVVTDYSNSIIITTIS
jgi:hypothetical protein